MIKKRDLGISPDQSTLFLRDADSKDLLILCSGRLPGLENPRRFSFFNRTKQVKVNRLFIRDNFGLCYHSGLEGISTGIGDTAQYISSIIEDHRFDRVSIIGASAGGYAALLFGQLAGADSIHSISPRTRLYPDPEKLAVPSESMLISDIWSQPVRDERYFDLRKFLESNPLQARVCRVYYDPLFGLDRYHAEYLTGLPGIELEELPGARHKAAVQLSRSPDFFSSVIECR